MDRKLMTVIGIVAVTAIVLSAAGIGYSMYMGNTYSEHNTMDTVETRVDIFYDYGTSDVDYRPISEPMSMPVFERAQTATISGYRVATTGPGSIYLQCQMENSACWALIDSMILTIDSTDYPFGVTKSGEPEVVTTGVPTSSIAMSAGSSFEYDGDTLLYYDFTITVTFSDIDASIDPNLEELSHFEGTEFMFVFQPSSN